MKSVPKWAAAGLCGYEVFTITTGRAPTITALCGRYRALGPALILALAVHLYRQPSVPRPAGDCPLCPVPF